MSTVPEVHAQLEKVIKAHRQVHHHSVREARRIRAARAAIAASESPDSVVVPDLEPQGMPGLSEGYDPLAGL
jgi:hypothetical protein